MRIKFKDVPLLSVFKTLVSDVLYVKINFSSALRLSSEDRLTIEFDPDSYIQIGVIDDTGYRSYTFTPIFYKVKDLKVGTKFMSMGTKYIVSEDNEYKKTYINLDNGTREKYRALEDYIVDEIFTEIN